MILHIFLNLWNNSPEFSKLKLWMQFPFIFIFNYNFNFKKKLIIFWKYNKPNEPILSTKTANNAIQIIFQHIVYHFIQRYSVLCIKTPMFQCWKIYLKWQSHRNLLKRRANFLSSIYSLLTPGWNCRVLISRRLSLYSLFDNCCILMLCTNMYPL